MALRKLRAFAREGQPDELDLDETIEQTAKNLGELEVVTAAAAQVEHARDPADGRGRLDGPATRELVSRLFTAAKKATHFRELRTYYFHNCVYGRVYEQATLPRARCRWRSCSPRRTRRYKLIVVGDALMAPWELMQIGSGWYNEDDVEGVVWLMRAGRALSPRRRG